MKVFIEQTGELNKKNVFDQKTGKFLDTITISLTYPYPYGYILDTTSGDGDNLDCFVITDKELKRGDIIECEPVGMMEQFEDGEEDHNILVTLSKDDVIIDDSIKNKLTEFVSHFFDHRENKVVKVGKFYGKEEAVELIKKCKD